MQYHKWFGVFDYNGENYYVRVYKEHGKIRLQALEKPPLSSAKYDMRVVTIHTDKGTRNIQFYLDEVRLGHENLHYITQKIYEGLGWRSIQ